MGLIASAQVRPRTDAGKDIYDAVAVTAGRFLANTHDSVLYAYRDNTTLAGSLKFYRPGTTTAVQKLGNLAPRVTGGADFIDVAAGDLDGELDLNGEYRDEAVVAWASASADNKLPVSVTVLAFGGASEASPLPTGTTTAVAPGKLDAAAIIAGTIRPVDSALALAVGDFNGDSVKEIAVAYLTSPTTLNVDIFRYNVTLVDHALQRSLARVGGATVTVSGNYKWNESISLAAGDFDGAVDPDTAIRRDELALATSERVILSASSHQQDVRLRLFHFACTDGVNCTTSPNLAVTLAGIYDLPDALTDNGTAPARKVQLVAGLFKVDPVNGWDFNRRQLAAAYTTGPIGDIGTRIRTIEVQSDPNFIVALSNPKDYYGLQRFWLAAGGFKGGRSSSDPLWSLALTMWGGTTYKVDTLQPSALPAAPEFLAGATSTTAAAPANGARLPAVAVDTDGDSMYLGAPVHMIIYDVVNLDFMLQEPPKHAYWDTDLAQVYSVSRTDDFNITMVSSEGTSFSSKSTDSSDWSIGGSLGGSAKATVGANASVVIAKTSMEASLEVSGKVAYDYQKHESDYNEGKQERTVTFTGATNKDDYLVGRLQALHIWRYRIFGMGLNDPDQSPFFEIVIPGGSTDLEADAGGLNFDWYQPTHENGNILSYPEFVEGRTFSPADLGSYTIPCEPGTPGCVDGRKTVTELLIKPAVQFCDGNIGARALTFSSETGGQCDAWTYYNGTCDANSATFSADSAATEAVTATQINTYDDPFAYCATVDTSDAPGEQYTGPALPDSIVQGLRTAMNTPDAPAELFEEGRAFWRCMDSRVYACIVGANIPCMEKADLSQEPTAEMAEFCQQNPGAEVIPAYVTGRATLYAWRCEGNTPTPGEPVAEVDAQGFNRNFWYELSTP